MFDWVDIDLIYNAQANEKSYMFKNHYKVKEEGVYYTFFIYEIIPV